MQQRRGAQRDWRGRRRRLALAGATAAANRWWSRRRRPRVRVSLEAVKSPRERLNFSPETPCAPLGQRARRASRASATLPGPRGRASRSPHSAPGRRARDRSGGRAALVGREDVARAEQLAPRSSSSPSTSSSKQLPPPACAAPTSWLPADAPEGPLTMSSIALGLPGRDAVYTSPPTIDGGDRGAARDTFLHGARVPRTSTTRQPSRVAHTLRRCRPSTATLLAALAREPTHRSPPRVARARPAARARRARAAARLAHRHRLRAVALSPTRDLAPPRRRAAADAIDARRLVADLVDGARGAVGAAVCSTRCSSRRPLPPAVLAAARKACSTRERWRKRRRRRRRRRRPCIFLRAVQDSSLQSARRAARRGPSRSSPST